MPDNEELFEEQDFSKKKLDFNVWKKIIAFMKPLKKEVIIAVTSMAFLAATDAIYPLFSKYAIDQILRPDANNVLHPELGNLKWFILMYVGFILAGLALVYLFILFAGKVQAELAYQIRKKAFLHLQELPFSYYDRTRTGWIMARMTADTRNLSDILSWGIIDVTWGLFMMLILTAVMFVINWKLALIAIAVVPILSLISKWFQKYILKTYRDIRKVNSKITGSYNEGITGVMTTKTLVLERDNEDDFRLLTGDMRSKSIRAAVIHGLYFPTVIFLIALGTAAVYYAGGIWVMEAGLSISTLILFTSYVWEFFDPVNNIAETYVRLQQAEASAERVVSLIESQPDIVDTPEVVAKYGTLFDYKRENFEPLRGDVEFRDVSFKYAVGERVLDRFNLQVRAGQSIALVGHTGAGKSTIVNLLCRFYEPTEGTILIDGIDYKNRSLGWLHSNLGYVLQTPHLFSGTVMENIKYGKLGASDEEAIAAAKAVEAHDFIMRFEKGYETECGEGGSHLSVGQKQLISFARAILADPKILVLDEATSSVDTETEQAIQTAIHKLLQGRTSFIVAHRLSTIVHSDRILVLEQGDVVEEGTHRELIGRQGRYYQLYTNQYSEDMLELSKH